VFDRPYPLLFATTMTSFFQELPVRLL